MSSLAIFLKLYGEIGILLAATSILFVVGRRIFETRVSPSFLIRLAQALVAASFILPLSLKLLPEKTLPVVQFKMFSGSGELNRPFKIEPHQGSKDPVTAPRPVNVQTDQLGALKQWLTDQYRPIAAQASFLILAGLLIGWFFTARRLYNQLTALRALLQRSAKIRRIGRVVVSISDEITIPFSTLTKREAYVVIPLDLAIDPTNFKLAIFHELQHHRHRDTAWARAIEALIALYFWNPALRFWKKEINYLQEFACDEALIGQRRVSLHDYGSCLLKVAEAALVHHDMRIGTVCMAVVTNNPNSHVSFLRRRIDMFPSHKRSKRRRVFGLVLGTLTLCLTAAVAYGAQQTLKPVEQLAPNPGAVTFDPDIQEIAESALAKYAKKFDAHAGFVLVSEVTTGRLLASASFTNDPKAAPHWELAYEVEPASAMKVPLIASALDEGVASPDETHDCGNGVAHFGHGEYRDWKPFITLTTSESLIQSSNICSIRVTQKLGSGGVAKAMSVFGFGIGGTTKSFPQARSGEIPDPSLYPADDYVAVVTNGLNATPRFHVTPLEMVQAFGAIANEGRLMKPVLADAPDSAIQSVRQAISPKTANEMKAILRRAVLEGTGRSAQSPIYTTAGKTSSAFAPTSKDHSETGGERAMGGFAGFAPVEDPKIAVYVGMIEPHDKNDKNAHGNRHAAPVFREVIERTLHQMNVAPDVVTSK